MKKQKVLALGLSLVMVASMLSACGKQENPSGNTDTTKTEVSVDFEDSKSGFALVKTAPRKADESTLTVKTVNGSKVLYMTNEKGADEMHLALDLDGMLGANISKLAKIEVAIGVDRPDSSKFAAIAGKALLFAGESADALVENNVGTWSVYTASKNPMVTTFDVSGVAMTAGADTYFVILKDDDTGATKGNFFIDDIRFLDKDGKLIECNKDVIMEPVGNKFIKPEEVPDVSAGVTFKDEITPGEWEQDCLVPAGFFKGMEGMPVELTIKYEVIPGDAGYLCWGLCNMEWKKLTKDLMAPDAAFVSTSQGDNGDGYFAVDRNSTEIKVVLSPEAVAALNDGFFGQSYHVDVFEITAKPAGATAIKEKVEDELTGSDWGQDGKIPVDVLKKFAGMDVTVTMTYEANQKADQSVAAPMDASWGKIYTTIPGSIAGLEEADEPGKIKSDGFIKCDPTKDSITFTLTAAGVDYFVTNGVDFTCQVFGLEIVEYTLEATPKTTVKEKVEDELTGSDWGQDGKIPVDVLKKFAGLDVTVTMVYEANQKADQSVAAPMDASWGKIYTTIPGSIKGLEEADEPGKIKSDGFIKCDPTKDSITFTLTAAGVDYFVANGVDFTCQVFGLEIVEYTLEAEAAASSTIKETVADETVATDWGQDGIVPFDVLAKFAGDVTVTLKYEAVAGASQSVFAPMDASWGKIYTTIPGSITGLEEADEIGKIKPDGFIKCDPAAESITFTLTEAGVKYFVENSVNFSGQVSGMDVYEIVFEGAAK